jgi:pilus assembly protein CpaF
MTALRSALASRTLKDPAVSLGLDEGGPSEASLVATMEIRQLVTDLRTEVASELHAEDPGGLTSDDRRELARELTLSRLRRRDRSLVASGRRPLDVLEEQLLAQAVLDALFGLGRLQSLVDDDRIENIDANGCDNVWVTYSDGSKARVGPVADNDDELIETIRIAAARFGLSERRFDVAHPELDLRLPDGSRLSALMSVTARPAISIRRHRLMDLTIEDLVTFGTLDVHVASFLAAAVRAGKNIVVAGAMNSGKTTLVRALASEISPRERIVTIEQAFELGLDTMPHRHPDLVALEAREANTEGEGAIGMAALVRRGLRMNADRVIVGEVLGDEVVPMLNAMSQGRSGSMCTIHADSSSGAFRRLASYAIQAPERLPLEATTLLVAGAVHFVVFLDTGEAASSDRATERSATGRVTLTGNEQFVFHPLRRKRFVSSVREVVDADGMQVVSNEIFVPGKDRRATPAAPLRPRTLDELMEHGYEPQHTSGDVTWR